jgi:superfamily I DNA/RNA helicase
MVELTKTQEKILETEGHLLVSGGPGSGKTTIAILKAAQLSTTLRPAQSILFLSFARNCGPNLGGNRRGERNLGRAKEQD